MSSSYFVNYTKFVFVPPVAPPPTASNYSNYWWVIPLILGILLIILLIIIYKKKKSKSMRVENIPTSETPVFYTETSATPHAQTYSYAEAATPATHETPPATHSASETETLATSENSDSYAEAATPETSATPHATPHAQTYATPHAQTYVTTPLQTSENSYSTVEDATPHETHAQTYATPHAQTSATSENSDSNAEAENSEEDAQTYATPHAQTSATHTTVEVLQGNSSEEAETTQKTESSDSTVEVETFDLASETATPETHTTVEVLQGTVQTSDSSDLASETEITTENSDSSSETVQTSENSVSTVEVETLAETTQKTESSDSSSETSETSEIETPVIKTENTQESEESEESEKLEAGEEEEDSSNEGGFGLAKKIFESIKDNHIDEYRMAVMYGDNKKFAMVGPNSEFSKESIKKNFSATFKFKPENGDKIRYCNHMNNNGYITVNDDINGTLSFYLGKDIKASIEKNGERKPKILMKKSIILPQIIDKKVTFYCILKDEYDRYVMIDQNSGIKLLAKHGGKDHDVTVHELNKITFETNYNSPKITFYLKNDDDENNCLVVDLNKYYQNGLTSKQNMINKMKKKESNKKLF